MEAAEGEHPASTDDSTAQVHESSAAGKVAAKDTETSQEQHADSAHQAEAAQEEHAPKPHDTDAEAKRDDSSHLMEAAEEETAQTRESSAGTEHEHTRQPHQSSSDAEAHGSHATASKDEKPAKQNSDVAAQTSQHQAALNGKQTSGQAQDDDRHMTASKHAEDLKLGLGGPQSPEQASTGIHEAARTGTKSESTAASAQESSSRSEHVTTGEIEERSPQEIAAGPGAGFDRAALSREHISPSSASTESSQQADVQPAEKISSHAASTKPHSASEEDVASSKHKAAGDTAPAASHPDATKSGAKDQDKALHAAEALAVMPASHSPASLSLMLTSRLWLMHPNPAISRTTPAPTLPSQALTPSSLPHIRQRPMLSILRFAVYRSPNPSLQLIHLVLQMQLSPWQQTAPCMLRSLLRSLQMRSQMRADRPQGRLVLLLASMLRAPATDHRSGSCQLALQLRKQRRPSPLRL